MHDQLVYFMLAVFNVCPAQETPCSSMQLSCNYFAVRQRAVDDWQQLGKLHDLRRNYQCNASDHSLQIGAVEAWIG